MLRTRAGGATAMMRSAAVRSAIVAPRARFLAPIASAASASSSSLFARSTLQLLLSAHGLHSRVGGARWVPRAPSTLLQANRLADCVPQLRFQHASVSAAAAATPVSTAASIPTTPTDASAVSAPPTTGSQPPPISAPDDPALIRRLNEALARYPLETLISLAVLEGVSFSLTKLSFGVLGIVFPANFAFAFLLSMPLRRSMLPKLTVAAPMALLLRRIAPSLARVHLSNVWTRRDEWMPEWINKRLPRRKPEAAVTAAAANAGSTAVEPPSFRARMAAHLRTLPDRYGLALLISYRMAGLVIVHLVYWALLRGVDLMFLLQFLGAGNMQVHSVLGSYAGAVVWSALWFPVTVFLAPYPALLLYKLRKRITGGKQLTAAAATAPAVAATSAPAAADVPTAPMTTAAAVSAEGAPSVSPTSASAVSASPPVASSASEQPNAESKPSTPDAPTTGSDTIKSSAALLAVLTAGAALYETAPAL